MRDKNWAKHLEVFVSSDLVNSACLEKGVGLVVCLQRENSSLLTECQAMEKAKDRGLKGRLLLCGLSTAKMCREYCRRQQ